MKKKSSTEKIKKIFFVLSDNTRLKIMMSLLDVGLCEDKDKYLCGKCQTLECMPSKSVGDIAREIGASQSLVSHQIRVLKDQGLVSSKKYGLRVYCRLKDGHVQQLIHVALDHVMEEQQND